MNSRKTIVVLFTLAVSLILISLVETVPPRDMEAETQSRIESLLGLIAIYTHDKGEPPPAGQWAARVFDFQTRSGWEREYAEGKSVPVDPWGTEYRYSVNQEKVTLLSAGADKTFETSDDINKTIEFSIESN
jgi:hypothetical protein